MLDWHLSIKAENDWGSEQSNRIFSIILFFVLGIFGFLFPVFFEQQIFELIARIIAETKDKGLFGLTAYIIHNNVQSAFFALIFGIVLGIVPLGVLIINGYVLGFISNKTIALEGPLVLWRLFPHGIFEIPAIMISIALGLKIGSFLFKAKKNLKKNVRTTILIKRDTY